MQILVGGHGSLTHVTFFKLQVCPSSHPPLLSLQSGSQKASPLKTLQRNPLAHLTVAQGVRSSHILDGGQGARTQTTSSKRHVWLARQPPLLRLQSGLQKPSPLSTLQRKPFWQRIVAHGEGTRKHKKLNIKEEYLKNFVFMPPRRVRYHLTLEKDFGKKLKRQVKL